jgi:hypothetical protein
MVEHFPDLVFEFEIIRSKGPPVGQDRAIPIRYLGFRFDPRDGVSYHGLAT